MKEIMAEAATDMSGDPLRHCMQTQAQTLGFVLDDDQLHACAALHKLYQRLIKPSWSFLPASVRRRLAHKPHINGVYLYGGVGHGKSFVMNAFYACTPLAQKRRVHFHHFMQDVHARLAKLKGRAHPLKSIARDLSRHVRLLCLDEFHIADITDAVLIRGLMHAMFDRGMTVVITANAPPDELYLNGLQRAQFLPTIELLKDRMTLVPFSRDVDYRLNKASQERTVRALPEAFRTMIEGRGEQSVPLQIEGRLIMARCLADGMAWFDCHELCTAPRGKADFIELANRFHTICLSGVRPFDQQSLAQARRFMWLVDEFYDRGIQLIFPDAESTAYFGHAGLLDGAFQRALSRLAEMQSSSYPVIQLPGHPRKPAG